MKKGILKIEIVDNGTVIGSISPEEFRQYFDVRNAFLQELVDRYNQAEEQAQSQVRARIMLKK